MIFNGHTAQDIDEIDQETFTDICVMYGDGVLGGKSAYEAIAPITTAIFNYIRDPQKSREFKADQLFPWIKEYERDPEKQEQKQDNLLVFMTQAPGFTMERFNV